MKWGLVALIVSVIAFGLWMALGDSPMTGSQTAPTDDSAPVLDPDDPRSRKSDRLPSAF